MFGSQISQIKYFDHMLKVLYETRDGARHAKRRKQQQRQKQRKKPRKKPRIELYISLVQQPV